ncbi:MAG: DUF1127 domain-containing protein [Rhodobacteraceae bacterium]|nr:DUF1127 domain-containing protein [Paracoccaceae bacterium]
MTYATTDLETKTFRGFTSFHGLNRMIKLYHERRALAKLDNAALKDVGLSHAEAKREANRAPWDAPAHWYR